MAWKYGMEYRKVYRGVVELSNCTLIHNEKITREECGNSSQIDCQQHEVSNECKDFEDPPSLR